MECLADICDLAGGEATARREIDHHEVDGAGALAAVAISCCATLERLPAVTYEEARQLDILDIPDARFYVSDTNRIYDVATKAYQRINRTRPAQTRHFLALSGGGDD